MMKLKARTDFEEFIQASCRSLFLTSAIPELVSSEGTMKQVEFLDASLRKEITTREENRRERLVKRTNQLVPNCFGRVCVRNCSLLWPQ